jgi:DNA-3-methyladenine glycosylase II
MVDYPLMQVEIIGDELDEITVTKARQQISRILGIEQDLLPFYRMAQDDTVLSPLMVQLRGLHIPRTASVYESLVLAIVGQQISSHVAGLLRTLLINTYGSVVEVAGHTYHSFPRVSEIAAAGIDGLRVVKLSNRKAQYIVGISNGIMSGELDLENLHSLGDEEVIRKLTSIRGVGLWTAHWLLIRALGRSDGFPYEDLALCRTLSQLLGLAAPLTPKEASEYSQRWSPFRSYATTYLFAAMRSGLIGKTSTNT